MSGSGTGDAALAGRAPAHAVVAGDRARSRATLADETTLSQVALAGVAAWPILFHPGFTSPDSAGQLVEARRSLRLAPADRGVLRPAGVALRLGPFLPACIALSGLAHQAGLLLIASAEDHRYAYWMIVAALIATTWVVIEAVAARSAPGSK